ncbi:hypothetical protein [Pseudomonas sp. EggHat1]|uniref:hypothetical protein n=1 Tax=Pseudomonas sp. EggHat1 TaxID=2761624 RepID=UPI001866987D|nr:hypothetical protein [Pseudomonas sp. EggHat1]
MRVDAGTSYPYVSQRQQTSANHSVATPSLAAQSATQIDGTKQSDFTSMTRQEMRDWVNTQISNGEMSLDDSRPFMAMTMKIPVGSLSGEIPAERDGARHDFTQKIRDGIEGAQSRNDGATQRMLESALQIIQRSQGQVSRVDVRA